MIKLDKNVSQNDFSKYSFGDGTKQGDSTWTLVYCTGSRYVECTYSTFRFPLRSESKENEPIQLNIVLRWHHHSVYY